MSFLKRIKNNGFFTNLNLQKGLNSIFSEDEFRSIIERERARADRTDQHFSLIILDLGFPDESHHATHHILQKVFRRVRRIDEIGWYGQNRIGIILPYTSAQGAQKFAESLCSSFSLTTKECLLNIYTYDSDQTNTAQANKGNI
jgi:PleD family two-component response regulator